MKLLKYVAVLSFIFSLTTYANTPADQPYGVPFYHLSLAAQTNIQVVYDFASERQRLTCWQDDVPATLSSVQWKYKGVTYTSVLPIKLMDNVHFKGHFADSMGTLIITNEGNSEPLVVSCEYRNVR